ncbi:unnamed protein product [Discosporangium mesarthrocarpum]
MMSFMYHEGMGNVRDGMNKRMMKYGGEKKAGEVVDLSKEGIPGVLTKKIIRPGNGELPAMGNKVSVHYTGKLEDGTEFDTSAGRGPLKFLLGGGEVIAGWDLGVSTMQKGERAILTVGPEYGYGKQGSGPIPENATLIFEMECRDWEAPPTMETYHWLALLVVLGIIYYVVFVDDENDRARKASQML